MPNTEVAFAESITIKCPACGASEAADPALLADAPIIVCRDCGRSWPADPKGGRLSGYGSSLVVTSVMEAERRPLVTYSDGADRAWSAKIEADRDAPEPRQSPLPMTIAAMAAIFFMAAFFGGREAAVAALPDLGSLYEALGLSVNLDGIAVQAGVAERGAGEEPVFVVHGVIHNDTTVEQVVPTLVAGIAGAAGRESLRSYEPPIARLAAGVTAPFTLRLEGLPRQTREIVVRFRRPAERFPAGVGTAKSG